MSFFFPPKIFRAKNNPGNIFSEGNAGGVFAGNREPVERFRPAVLSGGQLQKGMVFETLNSVRFVSDDF